MIINDSMINIYIYLVGGDWNHGILNDFPILLGIIIPPDFHIFQRGGYTTNQYVYVLLLYYADYVILILCQHMLILYHIISSY